MDLSREQLVGRWRKREAAPAESLYPDEVESSRTGRIARRHWQTLRLGRGCVRHPRAGAPACPDCWDRKANYTHSSTAIDPPSTTVTTVCHVRTGQVIGEPWSTRLGRTEGHRRREASADASPGAAGGPCERVRIEKTTERTRIAHFTHTARGRTLYPSLPKPAPRRVVVYYAVYAAAAGFDPSVVGSAWSQHAACRVGALWQAGALLSKWWQADQEEWEYAAVRRDCSS